MGPWEQALAERIGARDRAELWRRIGASCGQPDLEPFEVHARPSADGIPNINLCTWTCGCGREVRRGDPVEIPPPGSSPRVARCVACAGGQIRMLTEEDLATMGAPA